MGYLVTMRLTVEQPRAVVIALGTAQTIAWASTYYLPAILADSMARDTRVSVVMVFTAFSLAMVLSALLGPWVGRFIDRRGGRNLLLFSNAIFILGLFMLGMATDLTTLFAAWIVIGVGMGLGLYEAAFATLTSLYGRSARSVITGITLIAGFASTVGWPLSAFLEVKLGWRATCYVWALLHLVIALPLNVLLPDKPRDGSADSSVEDTGSLVSSDTSRPTLGILVSLSFVFAVTWFASTSMASHLPRLLEAAGATTAVAVAAGALIGPAQVIARILDYRFMQQHHPIIAARLASIAHPVGAVVLLLFGGPAAYIFTVFHGAGAGAMTIAKGTLPLTLIGPNNYGYWQGVISLPGRVLQAFAPLIFGFAIERLGYQAIWITTGLCLISFLVLLSLKRT
jgi:predicted MFS family arabinose efflux permease